MTGTFIMMKLRHLWRRGEWTNTKGEEGNRIMPTPNTIFGEIATRFGVNPDDEDAIIRFFDETAPTLPAEQQSEILAELLAGDASELTNQARTKYPKGTPPLTLDESPPLRV